MNSYENKNTVSTDALRNAHQLPYLNPPLRYRPGNSSRFSARMLAPPGGTCLLILGELKFPGGHKYPVRAPVLQDKANANIGATRRTVQKILQSIYGRFSQTYYSL
jgi:hypothetical protein